MSCPAKKNPVLFIYLREEKFECWKNFPFFSFFLWIFMFVSCLCLWFLLLCNSQVAGFLFTGSQFGSLTNIVTMLLIFCHLSVLLMS